jgi:hypothetical protein
MHKIAHLKLTFIDVSYSTKLTDKALQHLQNITMPLNSIIINDCLHITSVGLLYLIQCCHSTLLEIECANSTKAGNDVLKLLGTCWNLESVDLTGCSGFDDAGFNSLAKGEAFLRVGLPPVNPGLVKLTSLKLGGTKIKDSELTSLIK